MQKKWLSLLLISFSVLGYSLNETPDQDAGLNNIMSPTDQKKTGINKLEKDERAQLEIWLQNYALSKTNPANAEAIASFKPFIAKLSINARGGEFLILENDTVWAVDPNFVVISSGWLSPIPIAVTLNLGSEYPFRLTNQLSTQEVYAKKASWDDIPESNDLPTLDETTQDNTSQQPSEQPQTPLQHRQQLQSRQQQPLPNQNNPVPNPPKTGIDQAE
ncbi:MAG: hypothetical protein HY860_02160 [Chlamydiales bacterium]|nr:hypothetical protein [Chlamydiales bacterium]